MIVSLLVITALAAVAHSDVANLCQSNREVFVEGSSDIIGTSCSCTLGGSDCQICEFSSNLQEIGCARCKNDMFLDHSSKTCIDGSDCESRGLILIDQGGRGSECRPQGYRCTSGFDQSGSACFCPNNCEDCQVSSSGYVCLQCDANTLLANGQCHSQLRCSGKQFVLNGEKTDAACDCGETGSRMCKKCVTSASVNPDTGDQVLSHRCLSCRAGHFLHEGWCIDKDIGCPSGTAEYGLHSNFGRMCVPPGTLCFKEKFKDNDDLITPCRCPDPNCRSCRFQTGASGATCEKCKRPTVLHQGQCLIECPKPFVKAGTFCVESFMCENGRSPSGRRCGCPGDCKTCFKDHDTVTCHACKKPLFLSEGDCVKQCRGDLMEDKSESGADICVEAKTTPQQTTLTQRTTTTPETTTTTSSTTTTTTTTEDITTTSIMLGPGEIACATSQEPHIKSACSSCRGNLGKFIEIKSAGDIWRATSTLHAGTKIASLLSTVPFKYFPNDADVSYGVLPAGKFVDSEGDSHEFLCLSFYAKDMQPTDGIDTFLSMFQQELDEKLEDIKSATPLLDDIDDITPSLKFGVVTLPLQFTLPQDNPFAHFEIPDLDVEDTNALDSIGVFANLFSVVTSFDDGKTPWLSFGLPNLQIGPNTILQSPTIQFLTEGFGIDISEHASIRDMFNFLCSSCSLLPTINNWKSGIDIPVMSDLFDNILDSRVTFLALLMNDGDRSWSLTDIVANSDLHCTETAFGRKNCVDRRLYNLKSATDRFSDESIVDAIRQKLSGLKSKSTTLDLEGEFELASDIELPLVGWKIAQLKGKFKLINMRDSKEVERDYCRKDLKIDDKSVYNYVPPSPRHYRATVTAVAHFGDDFKIPVLVKTAVSPNYDAAEERVCSDGELQKPLPRASLSNEDTWIVEGYFPKLSFRSVLCLMSSVSTASAPIRDSICQAMFGALFSNLGFVVDDIFDVLDMVKIESPSSVDFDQVPPELGDGPRYTLNFDGESSDWLHHIQGSITILEQPLCDVEFKYSAGKGNDPRWLLGIELTTKSTVDDLADDLAEATAQAAARLENLLKQKDESTTTYSDAAANVEEKNDLQVMAQQSFIQAQNALMAAQERCNKSETQKNTECANNGCGDLCPAPCTCLVPVPRCQFARDEYTEHCVQAVPAAQAILETERSKHESALEAVEAAKLVLKSARDSLDLLIDQTNEAERALAKAKDAEYSRQHPSFTDTVSKLVDIPGIAEAYSLIAGTATVSHMAISIASHDFNFNLEPSMKLQLTSHKTSMSIPNGFTISAEIAFASACEDVICDFIEKYFGTPTLFLSANVRVKPSLGVNMEAAIGGVQLIRDRCTSPGYEYGRPVLGLDGLALFAKLDTSISFGFKAILTLDIGNVEKQIRDDSDFCDYQPDVDAPYEFFKPLVFTVAIEVTSAGSLEITGLMQGVYTQAFGIPVLHLANLGIRTGVTAALGIPPFEIAGEVALGSSCYVKSNGKYVTNQDANCISGFGGFGFHPTDFTRNYIAAGTYGLTLQKIVDKLFLADFSFDVPTFLNEAHFPEKSDESGVPLPNPLILYSASPVGASTLAGGSVPPGFTLSGSFRFSTIFKQDFNVTITLTFQPISGLKLRGSVPPISFGEGLKIVKSPSDDSLGPETHIDTGAQDPRDMVVKLAGYVKLLGLSAAADVSITADGSSFSITANLFGLFKASVHATGPSKMFEGNVDDWSIAGSFELAFLNKLKELAEDLINQAADFASDAVEFAEETLQSATSAASSAASAAISAASHLASMKTQKEIATSAYNSAMSAYNSAMSKANSAYSELRSASSKLASAESECKSATDQLGPICDCGRVCTPWGPCFCGNPLYGGCEAARKTAEHLCEPVLSAARSTLNAADAAYRSAQSSMNRAQSSMNSAKSSMNSAVSKFNSATNADRIAREAEDAANSALNVAQQGLDNTMDAVQIGLDAGKFLADNAMDAAITIDEARFSGKLKDFTRGSFSTTIKFVVTGVSHEITVSLDLDDLTSIAEDIAEKAVAGIGSFLSDL